MRGQISYGFVLGLAAWVVIILLRKNGIFIPVINNHFTDFITVPMYCYLIDRIMNFLGYPWKPDLKFVLTSVVYLSFLFEVLCPQISYVFTGDFFDVLAYCTGGMIYYIFTIQGFSNFRRKENKKANRF